MEGLEHLETGCKLKFEFHNFVKFLSKIRVVVGARVSSLVLCNMLGIYRVKSEGKKSEKRSPLECKNNFLSNKIKSLKI